MSDDPEEYSNIRQLLGHLIGRTVIDITQHDYEEFQETKQSYVMLMFDNGDYVKFSIGAEGFKYSIDEPESEKTD